MIRVTLLVLQLLLVGCATTPEAPAPVPVGTVALEVASETPPTAALLDVSIAVFDANVPEDPAERRRLGIQPEIREAEAKYLAFALRNRLVESGQWGAVRLLPVSDPTAALQISGRILRSDGNVLQLQLHARDSRQQVWIERVYIDVATAVDYDTEAELSRDPFDDLYSAIANDLLQARRQLGTKALQEIAWVSSLRYAAELSPEAFAGHLQQQGDGSYTVARLPAANDPMLERVQRIRQHEYSYVDAVDEQFGQFYAEMRRVYDAWRRFRHEKTLYMEDHEERAERRKDSSRSRYEKMRQTYESYRWLRMQEQDLRELAGGFDNEMKPTAMELEGRVVNLSGTMEAQYQEWRSILKSYFRLENDLAS